MSVLAGARRSSIPVLAGAAVATLAALASAAPAHADDEKRLAPAAASSEPATQGAVTQGAVTQATQGSATQAAVTQASPATEPPPELETVVTGTRAADPSELPEERATTRMTEKELETRLPQSAPEALRYEPGVFVQQTGHGQGSAYIRGLTGQQTLMLFDGIRLNNSTFRQGPNQYFFTIDGQTIASIAILRGGGSTQYGSDALGGVILVEPREPTSVATESLQAYPRLRVRGATADQERGGRVELDLARGELALLGGIGARRAGLLEGGGVVRSPEDGSPALVPRLAEDGRTQLGTGFDELTFDGRLRWQPSAKHTLTAAAYGYRQYDAPRTDQCPPPFAPHDECLRYLEQFRTLAYLAWDGSVGGVAERTRATLSWQRQHELREGTRPGSRVRNLGRDDVDTLGVTLAARSAAYQPHPALRLRFTYGADTYVDWIASRAFVTFTDIDYTAAYSRGQYLDGSRYVHGGAFLSARATLWRELVLHAGGRLVWVDVNAPGDPDSSSAAVSKHYTPIVGSAGAEWRVLSSVTLLATVDRSFRAPNLDDLTGRQQTGPGFQFENAALGPEWATTLELGTRLRTEHLRADLWAFRTLLTDAITRQPRDVADCPPEAPQCNSSWNRFSLVNSSGTSELRGLEALVEVTLGVASLRTTATWIRGDGPNPAEPPSDPTLPYDARVPLSRVPPLNGTVELGVCLPAGFTLGGALRWATTQDRLAVADRSDARIPRGGTPGFAVIDARAGYRWRKVVKLAVVFENLFDAAYRYHGSSINGRGRGVMAQLELDPLSDAEDSQRQ